MIEARRYLVNLASCSYNTVQHSMARESGEGK
jgi:hypothetical protein